MQTSTAVTAEGDVGGSVEQVAPAGARKIDALLALYGAAVFVAAGLVFLVQPMVTRMVLPRLGGTPAVWNTSLLFFQLALLLGYGYAHLISTRLPVRRQLVAHGVVLLLPFIFLPISLPGWDPPELSRPTGWLLAVLAVSAGVPYFAVATASPLLQRWFSHTGHRAAADPYFLYAAGNAGSLIGLLAYPALVEPRFALADQARLWAGLYILFVLLAFGVAWRLRSLARSSVLVDAAAAVDAPATSGSLGGEVTLVDRLRWMALGAIPSSLMVGATTFISTDIASVPLLWVLPLSAYLFSFIVAFGKRRVFSVARVWPFVPILGAVVTMQRLVESPRLWVTVLLHVLLVLAVGLLCHGRLADQRPSAERLTEFYLLVSIGGAIGGAFNALVAPQAFDTVLEYPLVIGLALLAGRWVRTDPVRWMVRVGFGVLGAAILYHAVDHWEAVVAVAVVVGLVASRSALTAVLAVGFLLALSVARADDGSVFRSRSFYGTLKIEAAEDGQALINGTTVHGFQLSDRAKAQIATTYYHASGPVGRAIGAWNEAGEARRVGVVGLGSGTIATYAQPGQHYTFFDIDPEVVRLSLEGRRFSFVRDARGTVDIVLGDARRTLARQPDTEFDVLVLDAFSSDAIPVHLMTREAFELYFAKLKPGGLLLVHISNRYFDLEPVVGAIARDNDLDARVWDDFEVSEAQAAEHKEASQWVAVTHRGGTIDRLDGRGDWKKARVRGKAWRDDFSNVLTVLR